MENLHKKPSKGILKSSSSFEQQTEVQQKQVQSTDKDIKWDEMNILQTLHPVDKDYGHMKIEEPKTPFNYYSDSTDGEQHNESHDLDANALARNLSEKGSELPKVLADSEEEEESDDENLTEDEKSKKKDFEVKRKMHYNEFQAVKLARKLLEEEDEEDDDEEANCDQTLNGNELTQQKNCEQAIDEGIETSGTQHIHSEDTDEVQNR